MTTHERPRGNGGAEDLAGSVPMVAPSTDTAPEAAPFQVMPPLSDDEYAALRDDIAAHGVRVPVDVDQHGRILDGHHRARVCAELGIEVPTRVVEVADDAAAREHAYATNTARRHLTRDQRRSVVVRSLLADPGLSDRAHAARCGVSPTTVGNVRAVLVDSGQVSNVDTRRGADGHVYTVTRPSRDQIEAEEAADAEAREEQARIRAQVGRWFEDWNGQLAMLAVTVRRGGGDWNDAASVVLLAGQACSESGVWLAGDGTTVLLRRIWPWDDDRDRDMEERLGVTPYSLLRVHAEDFAASLYFGNVADLPDLAGDLDPTDLGTMEDLIREGRDRITGRFTRLAVDLRAAGVPAPDAADRMREALDEGCAQLPPWPYDEHPDHEDLIRSWVEPLIAAVLAEAVPA